MKIVVAIDSFKGSLSTFQSGLAVRQAAERVLPNAEVVISPLADGGEGTVEAIVAARGGRLETVTVTGPLGTPVKAQYGFLPDAGTAVIEMSAAAGITLIAPEERDPLLTTTYGVGELIAHAVTQNGARKFIVGIGGSATNDGGVGMLQALGVSFLDANGNEIEHGAEGLSALSEIRCESALAELSECEFSVACDVTNPLCGTSGCSAVYGPQKGATPETVKTMDAWLLRYAELTRTVRPDADPDAAGAGAAGGMGFAFLAYLGGKLTSGIELVMNETRLEREICDADLVITGEGRLDGQSCMGKAPVGVARLAKKYGKRVIAFAGCVTEDARLCNAEGIDAFFPILRAPCTLAEAMDVDNAARNLTATAEQVLRLLIS